MDTLGLLMTTAQEGVSPNAAVSKASATSCWPRGMPWGCCSTLLQLVATLVLAASALQS